ncbi:MAG: Zn-dependent hydrolase, partial [Bryobacteraceae bacterium]
MPHEQSERAGEVIRWCRQIAALTEEPGWTTRTFLSPPMREVHARLRAWMERLGMAVRVDDVGNLRGFYAGRQADAPRLLIGSHLDTVPHAGAFDGVLGVVLGIALIEALDGRRLGFGIEVAGFSEEEGIRFGAPFIASRALVGAVDGALLNRQDSQGVSVAEAIRAFGLDPARIPEAALEPDAIGYVEFHIEQGPVLESLALPLGVVEAIAGQSRFDVRFEGKANHAGTTPMNLRRDALAAAAEWIGCVEREACANAGLVASVGRLEVDPGAVNVIAGMVRASLDVRHPQDEVRLEAAGRMLAEAREIAAGRGVLVEWEE